MSRRLPLGLLFTASSTLGCFAAGTWVGARFLVPPGSGLAGSAIAVGYGLAGALAGGAAAALLAYRLPLRWVRWLTVPSAAIGFLVLLAAARIYLRSKAEQQAQLEEAYAKLPPFRLELTRASALAPASFSKLAFDSEAAAFHATATAGTACSGPLSGADNVAVLTALRNVEGLLLKEPRPCADGGEVAYRIAFRIEEARPPDSQGELAATSACLTAHAALRDLVATGERLYGKTRCR